MLHVGHQLLIMQEMIWSVFQYCYIYCLLQVLSCPFFPCLYMREYMGVIFFFYNDLTSSNFHFYLRLGFLCEIPYSLFFCTFFCSFFCRRRKRHVGCCFHRSRCLQYIFTYASPSWTVCAWHGFSCSCPSHPVSSGDLFAQSFFNPLVDFREQH